MSTRLRPMSAPSADCGFAAVIRTCTLANKSVCFCVCTVPFNGSQEPCRPLQILRHKRQIQDLVGGTRPHKMGMSFRKGPAPRPSPGNGSVFRGTPEQAQLFAELWSALPRVVSIRLLLVKYYVDKSFLLMVIIFELAEACVRGKKFKYPIGRRFWWFGCEFFQILRE